MRCPIELAKAIAAVATLVALIASDGVRAQQPTPEQTSAIRASCRSDFMANCSGVTPGGKDALECLKRNLAKLSGACQTAVSAIAPAPTASPAAAAPPPVPAAVAPASGPAAAPAPPAAPKPAAAQARKPASKPSAAAVAPAAPAKPTPEQTSAIRAACRADFMAHCSGVTPGGAEALQCLQRNSARVSAPCQSAVAAIGGGPAPAIAAPATAAPAPGLPPLGPVRPVLPRRALLVLEICRADQQTLCAGIPPGGGRVLSCLAENGPHLSAECYEAIAPLTR